jgi:hypothetical protein
VFNGVDPVIDTFADQDEEAAAVGRWLADRIAEGVPPHEIRVFVRANGQLRRARSAVKTACATAVELSDKIETTKAASRSAPCTWLKVSNSVPLR